MENLRRRTEREVADARAYGVANLARDMLSVADNLARAVESVPAEARAAADAALKALIEGVELTERDLQAALGRHGVTKLEPQGEKFDPNFHQAMYEVPDETVPAGLGRRRSCRAAGRSANACCARPWSASPRAAPRPRRRRTTPRRRRPERRHTAGALFPRLRGEG